MATVVQWTVEDVAAWLDQCLHLPYADGFVQAGVDGVQLVHLTQQGLLNLGVDSEEHVKCLLDHVAVLRIQWERSLRGSQDAEVARSSFNSSSRSASTDGNSQSRKRTGRTVWPHVGSPILHAAGGKTQRFEMQGDGMKDGTGVEEPYLPKPDTVKVAVGAEALEARDNRATELEGVSKDVAEAQPDKASPHVATMNPSFTSATSLPIAEFAAGLPGQKLPLPVHRSLIPPSMAHGNSSARSASEVTQAMSRCSSAPTSCKRGPSAAAEGGASLFLSDQSRGAFFGTTTRGVEVLPDSLGPDPACYNSNAAASKTVLRANIGSMKFSSEPRRTMECMYIRGASGPGSGKYHPPPRSTSRGGSFPRAPRWNTRSGPCNLPGTPPAVAPPGPTSYRPNHSVLSTLR